MYEYHMKIALRSPTRKCHISECHVIISRMNATSKCHIKVPRQSAT